MAEPRYYLALDKLAHEKCPNCGKSITSHAAISVKDACRALLESKRVHHIDGNPCNNDPDNLELR